MNTLFTPPINLMFAHMTTQLSSLFSQLFQRSVYLVKRDPEFLGLLCILIFSMVVNYFQRKYQVETLKNELENSRLAQEGYYNTYQRARKQIKFASDKNLELEIKNTQLRKNIKSLQAQEILLFSVLTPFMNSLAECETNETFELDDDLYKNLVSIVNSMNAQTSSLSNKEDSKDNIRRKRRRVTFRKTSSSDSDSDSNSDSCSDRTMVLLDSYGLSKEQLTKLVGDGLVFDEGVPYKCFKSKRDKDLALERIEQYNQK